jgi:hypothetical protein
LLCSPFDPVLAGANPGFASMTLSLTISAPAAEYGRTRSTTLNAPKEQKGPCWKKYSGTIGQRSHVVGRDSPRDQTRRLTLAVSVVSLLRPLCAVTLRDGCWRNLKRYGSDPTLVPAKARCAPTGRSLPPPAKAASFTAGDAMDKITATAGAAREVRH